MRSQRGLNAKGCVARLCLALLALAGAPAAAEPKAEQPRSPGEIRFEEANRAVKEGRIRYFPLKALEPGVSGRATLNCLVEADGWFTDCRVESEDPIGYDFGATALTMAPLFKANPAAAGQRIQTPLNFKPPR